MKSSTNIGMAILGVAIMVSGLFISNIQVKSRAFDRSVEVKGLAEREVAADLGVWPVQVTLTSNNLNKLKADLEQQKATVIEFFRQQGFSPEEFSTGPVNIQDTQANPYGNNANLPYRYIAQMEFTVRTNNLQKLQNSLTASLELVAQGILIGSKNTWQPIEYIFTSLNTIKPDMIEEATKNAREVAEKFAKDSDSRVGKIKSAKQGVFSITDRDQNTPFVKNVRVVTTIDYFIKD